MNNKVTRRSFLKTAGVATVGAVAAGSLAGCGNATIAAAPADVKTTSVAGMDTPAWLGCAPEVAESEIVDTLQTEVLVCGCGTAGFPASISAAEAGAQVMCIERDATLTTPKEDIGALNSRYQLETIAEDSKYAIDKQEFLEEVVRYANGYVNYDLVKLWEDKSGDYMNWFSDILEGSGAFKMYFEAGVGQQNGRDKAFATGHSPKKISTDDAVTLVTVLQSYGENLGVDYRTETSLVKIERNSAGRVTGIIARNMADSTYVRINASKGVIICTGGYATNVEMMNALQPEIQQLKISCGKGNANTGDGIRACMWLGARKDPIGTSMLFNRACCLPTETAGYPTVGRWFWFGEQPNLKVNLNGKRFCNESGPYDYMLHSAYMQPQHTYVTIWDSNSEANTKQFDEVGCCRLWPFDNGAPQNIPYAVVMGKMVPTLIEDGYVIQADTLDDLATQLGIPVDTFKQTVSDYNTYAAAGEDPDYYKEPNRITPVSVPPYFGARTGAWHLTTLDGINIDTNINALDQDNNPIEGLYVAGDASGSFFSTSYFNLATGLACGRSMLFGYLAGKNAAASA